MTEETARASVLIDASPEEVWEALTDPDAIKDYYLGAKVETDWNVGSPITWSGEWDGTKYEDKGEILTAEPGEELSYSHWSSLAGSEDVPGNYHVIRMTLDEQGGQTEVALTQSNLEGGVTAADRENRDDYENNWSTMLEGLKKTVEG